MAVGSLIGLLIGAFVGYWVIRGAVGGALRDFEVWKRKRYGESGNQYDQYDDQA